MNLEEYLDTLETEFDAGVGLYGRISEGPGYHSRIPGGIRVHAVLGNFDTAVLLLRSSRPEDHRRAADMLSQLLRFQDQDPVQKTFGIWPWVLEESLAEMSPPDWNWADFCGAAIAVILRESASKLPEALGVGLRQALDNAAASIFRRNMGPNYTNISIMGTCVCASAGEILGEVRWLRYARRRLAVFLAHTEWHGGFNEYNSPTYTPLALRECERMLQLVTDPELCTQAETLRNLIWARIAERFHPATGQLAGPHSRAYADTLSKSTAGYLQEMTGVPIAGADPCENATQDILEKMNGVPVAVADACDRDPSLSVVKGLPCPESLRQRFERLPESPCEIRSRFLRREPEADSIEGHTWLSERACLGSVNYDCLWIQRRVLLAYLATDSAPACLMVRVLKDGKPCAAAVVRTHQEGPAALSVFQMATGLGDHHIHLDIPPDGIFPAKDLRIRYSLTGPGVEAVRIDSETFFLTVASHGVLLRTAPAMFDGAEAEWILETGPDFAHLDAVLWQGPRRDFRFKDLGKTMVAAALELTSADTPLTTDPVSVTCEDESVTVKWRALRVTGPLTPPEFSYPSC